jgi:hypothetical protein
MKLASNFRYATGLAGFLHTTLAEPEARRLVEAQLARREQAFLRMLERGVFANPASPYQRLLTHAGITLGDATELVEQHGLEGALERLHDAGVYVTYEESRGITPISRGSLTLTVKPGDFGNPLLASSYEARTSGSRSAGRRIFIDLEFLQHEAAQMALMLASYGLAGMPTAVWRPIPPDSSGLKRVLCYTKIGRRPERWFSQSRLHWNADGARAAALLGWTLLASRLSRSIPRPRFVPRDRALVVAEWLAAKKRQGAIGYVDTSASGAIRACIAAKENGLDISGSAFRTGGEPFTAAKASILAAAGASAVQAYAMAELGYIGIGCTDPAELDDLHLATDKVAVIQHDRSVSANESVPALTYTTLLPSCPVLMLNMESGDYGRLDYRRCGCLLGEVGLSTHLLGLRSYDKLTSEGVTFVGSELYHLVEELLPARFGGYPTDYQLVEEEVEGLTRISIIVAPGVGAIDDAAVVEAVLRALEEYPRGGAAMTEQWRTGRTLRVVRREPYASGDGRKVLPLYVLNRPAPTRGSRAD